MKNDWTRTNFWFPRFWNSVGIKYTHCLCKKMTTEELAKWVLLTARSVKAGVYTIFLSSPAFKSHKKLSIHLVSIVQFSMDSSIDYGQLQSNWMLWQWTLKTQHMLIKVKHYGFPFHRLRGLLRFFNGRKQSIAMSLRLMRRRKFRLKTSHIRIPNWKSQRTEKLTKDH